MTRPSFAQKGFSMHRFQQIPEVSPEPEHPMDMPNDVTIDIPLGNEGEHGPEEEQGQGQGQDQGQQVQHEQQQQSHQHEEHQHDSQQGQQQGQEHSETHSKTDSMSFFRYQSASEGADPGNSNNNNMSEKAHLVPDCDQSSTGRRRRGRNRKTANSVDDDDADDEGCYKSQNLTQLGRMYRSILNSSLLIRYLIYITPIAVLIAVPIIVSATVVRGATIGGVTVYWFFAWIEVIWLSLWVAKILARGVPYVVQFLSGIVSPGTRKYALMLRALEIPILLVGWTLIALVTFFPVSSTLLLIDV